MPNRDHETVECRIEPEGRRHRYQSVRGLLMDATECRELQEGYAFRFRGDDDSLSRLTGYIASERRCCSFLRFELSVEPDGGPIWLRLTGPEPVRRFVQDALTEMRQIS